LANRTRIAKTRKQGGLTLIGFIIVLSIALFVAYVGMKIGPIYMEYYSVVSAMNDMSEEKGNAKKSPVVLRRKLQARLYVSYSSNVKDNHIKVTRSDGVKLRVAYSVREPILGNLDVIISFDKSVPLLN
jgi:Tfp pilus assembly major pilin PilA